MQGSISDNLQEKCNSLLHLVSFKVIKIWHRCHITSCYIGISSRFCIASLAYLLQSYKYPFLFFYLPHSSTQPFCAWRSISRRGFPGISLRRLSLTLSTLSPRPNIAADMPFKAPENPKCPKCGKSVYHAEARVVGDISFHKECYKCSKLMADASLFKVLIPLLLWNLLNLSMC